MKTIRCKPSLKITLKIISITFIAIGLLIYPTNIADGIRNGISLLGENIIPSLFPFIVLSSYVSGSNATDYIAHRLHKISYKIFSVNAYGFIAFIMGVIGGYPIGAKTTADFLLENKLSEKEARRVMLWCVNPGPAFVITAVGTYMAGSTLSGIILYLSCISSSLLIGLFHSFLCYSSKSEPGTAQIKTSPDKHLFIKAVADGSRSMLSICGWVLVFCGVSSITNAITDNKNVAIFLNSLSEVTLGCKTGIEAGLSLPLICAVLGFGGFAVTAQVSPYLEKCGVSLKAFVAWRLVNGALSAFICTQLTKLFPQAIPVFSQNVSSVSSDISYSLPAAIFLIMMCFVFVLEVDNRKKIC